MSERKATLSFEKLSTLLKSKEYTLATVYCNADGEIYFVEARTPKIQKTFVISIPSKYKMKITADSEHYKSVIITKLSGGIESRQLEYITEVKGPLLDCDLLSISSSAMCLCKNNGSTEVYKFGNIDDQSAEDVGDDDNIENLEEPDPVEKIIHTAKKIDKKLGEEEKLELEGEDKEESGDGKEEEEPENGDEILENEGNDEKEEETPIELVFQDADGKPVELEETKEEDKDVKEGEVAASPENEELKKEVEEVSQKPRDDRRRDNSIPECIEDADISLGIIYYVIEIGSFNKKIAQPKPETAKPIGTFEDEIMSVYDTIDDNESDIRNARLDEVTEMAAKLALKAKEEVERCKREELGLKSQILKLSAVLEHCEKLKTKMTVNPEKYTDVKPEIERLYKQTKTTLYDMNVEILRNKDRADETLAKYQTSLEDLLEEK